MPSHGGLLRILHTSTDLLLWLRRSTGTCPSREAASPAPPLPNPPFPRHNPPWEPPRPWEDPRHTPHLHTTPTSAGPRLLRAPSGGTWGDISNPQVPPGVRDLPRGVCEAARHPPSLPPTPLPQVCSMMLSSLQHVSMSVCRQVDMSCCPCKACGRLAGLVLLLLLIEFEMLASPLPAVMGSFAPIPWGNAHLSESVLPCDFLGHGTAWRTSIAHSGAKCTAA